MAYCVVAAVMCIIDLHLALSFDLYFSSNLRHVSEDVGSISIDIASRARREREAFLRFRNNAASHATPGVDYLFQSVSESAPVFNFTISPGAIQSFEMVIVDDNIDEQKETVHFEIGVYVFGRQSHIDEGRVYIEDNDGLYFELMETGITVNEDVCTVELCVHYSQGENMPSTATAGVATLHRNSDDFVFDSNGVPFTLSTGDSVCLDMGVTDNNDNYKHDKAF
jgi:hypothetical protein